ncbi:MULTISPECIES: ATP-binding protein [unclassified Pseudoalteromonas]|uniref:ATP-binding protein n=1 Tax=unclassified Pseudoalteromonas TaxID=194690 RepID=UPI000C7B8D0D|nr:MULTISPECIES: ATP-binding protein [unclassified Pseudoalteromonas]AUJ71024.1 Phytochrome-like protein cph1 [Pseudoalteromonas sp. NC201]MCX2766620.1 ATP-binding protein [Pseudoalteromonas sp. B530]NSY34138.1 GAF domain-containing protein [Pseudoalteromonas sp. JC28]
MEKFEATLDNCHKEPIHIPGSIQPHGYLLLFDTNTLTLRYFSENFAELVGLEPSALVNTHAETIFESPFFELLASNANSSEIHRLNPMTATIKTKDAKWVELSVVASQNEAGLILELEQNTAQGVEINHSMQHLMKHSLSSMVDSQSLQASFEMAVEEIRELTQFDRVMLYKFDHEYNGEVVAESKRNDLNSFLNQHFPESDIPKQARALYLRNPIRLLADVDSENSLLYPQDKPIDLSACILRSVSPIHCQYLRNMGVQATMSISIIVAGKLWGLIACHHYEKHVVPFNIREVAQYMGLMLSYLISLKISSLEAMAEAKALTLSSSVTERMAKEIFFVDGLRYESAALQEMMKSSGVAWRVESDLECYGQTPAKADIESIYRWLAEHQLGDDSIFYCHSLGELNETFKVFAKTASGVLLMPLSADANHFIMWFRKEVIQTKNWGGKPEKSIEFLDDGSHRLMPRSSFKLWVENVKCKSHPWTEAEVSCALKFRNTLVNYVLAKSERYKKLNAILEQKVTKRTEALENEITSRRTAEQLLTIALEKAHESNQELERFAFLASHDLQEPLRKIQMFGDRIQCSAEGLNERHASYLKRMMDSAERMQKLIKGLLSFSRIDRKGESFKSFDGDNALAETLLDLELVIKESNAQVDTTGLGDVFGDRRQLQRVLLNLINNGIKFSAPERTPRVSISSERKANELIVAVKDNGIGFDPEFSEQIFNLFERLHGRSAYAGTGLGLAICKKIVERHHGRIWVETEVGQGSTFYFSLPISAQES